MAKKRTEDFSSSSISNTGAGAAMAREHPVPGIPKSGSDQEEIARLAYSYWEARGRHGGSSEEDWLRAEREVRNRRKSARL